MYYSFAAKLSRYKNPVNEVGVTTLYGIDAPMMLTSQTLLKLKQEHTLAPTYLIDELRGFDRAFFKMVFSDRMVRRFYRLYEFETVLG